MEVMKYLVIVPAMVPAIFENCFNSLDASVKNKLLVIDNSKDGFAWKYDVDSEHHPENIGIPRAWNIGARKVLEQGLDYLVVMSSTMVFDRGMLDFVQYMESNTNPWGLETQHIWHLIALKRKMIERCGLFDENFYPGYYEDSDYIRRWELNGIHNPMSQTQKLPKVQVAAGLQGNATAIKSGLKVNMGASRQYFIDKWGYEPLYDSQESRDRLYLYPFNNPKNDITFWEERSIEELRKKYGL